VSTAEKLTEISREAESDVAEASAAEEWRLTWTVAESEVRLVSEAVAKSWAVCALGCCIGTGPCAQIGQAMFGFSGLAPDGAEPGPGVEIFGEGTQTPEGIARVGAV
jgi:hypothetical protein